MTGGWNEVVKKEGLLTKAKILFGRSRALYQTNLLCALIISHAILIY